MGYPNIVRKEEIKSKQFVELREAEDSFFAGDPGNSF